VTEPEITPANLRRAPAERAARAVLPVSGLVWGAAEIMHACAWPGSLDITLVAATGTAVAYGVAAKKGWTWRLPSWTAFGGAWMAFAVNAGPLAGWPYAPLTWGWGVTAITAWKLAHRHEAVVEARDKRLARAGWLEKSRSWGLHGTHLKDYGRTRVGERYLVWTKGSGRRASAVAGNRNLREDIAEHEGLDMERVQIRSVRPGLVEISIEYDDPWKHPVPHPLFDDAPEIDLSGPYSIMEPAVVGQDPASGELLSITLYDEIGGKSVSFTARRGMGKTVLLNCLSERITKAGDAIQFRINLSDVGLSEAERWGPACHLTAFGPHQAARAARVLEIAKGIIAWRAARYAGRKYVPSPQDPAVFIIFDEADSAKSAPNLARQMDDVATKGRQFGVNPVRAGQRGTQDYGSAKMRSQDDVVCVGAVGRDSEIYHAAGSAGYQLPDIAAYTGGRPGGWAITSPGAGYTKGRSFDLDEVRDIQAIVAERAHWQPDLHPDCREFLGEKYEILLSTDVYAKWALTHRRDGTSAPVTVRAAAPPPPGSPGTAVQPGALLTDDDYLRHLDKTMTMDPADNAAFSALDAKLAGLRKTHEETAAMRAAAPDGNPGKEAEMAEARWEQAARQTEIPPLIREQLFTYLAGEGMSGRRIVDALAEDFPADKPTRNAVMLYLNRLRYEKKAYVHGKAALARWRLVTDGGDGS
jgi:hypothetical protein